jgi:hypothetical protein
MRRNPEDRLSLKQVKQSKWLKGSKFSQEELIELSLPGAEKLKI